MVQARVDLQGGERDVSLSLEFRCRDGGDELCLFGCLCSDKGSYSVFSSHLGGRLNFLVAVIFK